MRASCAANRMRERRYAALLFLQLVFAVASWQEAVAAQAQRCISAAPSKRHPMHCRAVGRRACNESSLSFSRDLITPFGLRIHAPPAG
jgi:hypothetical protein